MALADGLKVFPCAPDKRPRLTGWPENATTDPATIAGWSRQWPDSMVGVPTGEAQGLFVLDVDVKNGIDGFASLKALGVTLPATRTHRTRSGGVHLVFRYPPGEALTISAGQLGPGLDTRGNRGYVIWPGSPDYEVVDDSPIANLPAELLARLKAAKPKKPQRAPPHLSLVKAAPEPVWRAETLEARLAHMLGPMTRLGFSVSAMEAAIRAEVHAELLPMALKLLPASSGPAVTVGEGGRNASLAKWAGVLRAAGWSHAGLLAGLRVVNDSFLPPLSPDEVATTVGSIARYPPGEISEPIPYDGGHFLLTERGVTFQKDGETQSVCASLRVVAMGRDGSGHNWVKRCEWQDHDGRDQFAYVPEGELLKRNSELPSTLANQGLAIFNPALLLKYLAACKPDRRLLMTKALGWHGHRFVLPDETLGSGDDEVHFQSDAATPPAFEASGTVEGWKRSVGRLAIGNSRLLFAISTSLAGPLLDLAGMDSAGFHLRGGSSTGKTTCLRAAASVWGGRRYVRSWHATGNGIEATAALHNDLTLFLDELGQADGQKLGAIAYMLGNGLGKGRASASGAARKLAAWRLMILSTGEESLTDLVKRGKGVTFTGQEIRLADIEADAGKGMGAFEELHGLASPNALALALDGNRHHGAAGPAWIRHLVEAREAVSDMLPPRLKEIVALWASPSASGAVLRVCRSFALIALAGELASEAGLTGWPEGEATRGVKACFDAWRVGFGGESGIPREEQALLEHVRSFLEKHGDSRFQPLAPMVSPCGPDGTGGPEDEGIPTNRYPVNNRAGFRRERDDGSPEYLVLPEAFKEICKGHAPEWAAKVLHAHGWLDRREAVHFTTKVRIGGMRPRVYILTAKVLA